MTDRTRYKVISLTSRCHRDQLTSGFFYKEKLERSTLSLIVSLSSPYKVFIINIRWTHCPVSNNFHEVVRISTRNKFCRLRGWAHWSSSRPAVLVCGEIALANYVLWTLSKDETKLFRQVKLTACWSALVYVCAECARVLFHTLRF